MKKSYRPPAEDLFGYKTFVHPDTADSSDDPKSVLPSPPWSKSKPVPPLQFGKPGGGQNYRVPNKPGEESHIPDAKPTTFIQRRPEVNSSVRHPGPPPAQKKQHDQRGQAKMYHKKYYQGNKGKIKHRMEIWYTKNKNKSNFKRDQQKRRKTPQLYERKPGGGIQINKNRSRQDRKKKSNEIAYLYSLKQNLYGVVTDVCGDTGLIGIQLEGANEIWVSLYSFLSDYVMLSYQDINIVLDMMDVAFDFNSEMSFLDRVADFYYEKSPPEMDPNTTFDRGSERQKDDDPPVPGQIPYFQVSDNPGSAKVIPDNKDFVNNKSASIIADIYNACSPNLQDKSKDLSFKLVRVNNKNAMWTFDVQGSKGKVYKVKVKAVPKNKRLKDMSKVDIQVSCTCPYWKWQGPEHYAQQDGYLLGKPVGTASKPSIKDPDSTHKACKHVLAILDRVSGFTVPSGRYKKASIDAIYAVSDNYMDVDLFLYRYGLRKALTGGNHANL